MTLAARMDFIRTASAKPKRRSVMAFPVYLDAHLYIFTIGLQNGAKGSLGSVAMAPCGTPPVRCFDRRSRSPLPL